MKTILTIFYVTICLFTLQSACSAQIAVIANKSVPTNSINLNTLKALYFLDSKEIEGATAKLFCYRDESDITSSFFAALGKPFKDTKKIWIRMKLTGNGEPPATVSSEEELVAKVSSTPGAIGFISAAKVTGQVKVRRPCNIGNSNKET